MVLQPYSVNAIGLLQNVSYHANFFVGIEMTIAHPN